MMSFITHPRNFIFTKRIEKTSFGIQSVYHFLSAFFPLLLNKKIKENVFSCYLVEKSKCYQSCNCWNSIECRLFLKTNTGNMVTLQEAMKTFNKILRSQTIYTPATYMYKSLKIYWQNYCAGGTNIKTMWILWFRETVCLTSANNLAIHISRSFPIHHSSFKRRLI